MWAKRNGFKYVWHSEGNILIKKTIGEQTFVIRKQQDLQNMPVIQQTENPLAQPALQSTQASTSTNPIIHPPTPQIPVSK